MYEGERGREGGHLWKSSIAAASGVECTGIGRRREVAHRGNQHSGEVTVREFSTAERGPAEAGNRSAAGESFISSSGESRASTLLCSRESQCKRRERAVASVTWRRRSTPMGSFGIVHRKGRRRRRTAGFGCSSSYKGGRN